MSKTVKKYPVGGLLFWKTDKVKRMREFGQIDWIDDVNESILHQKEQTGITSRRFRKGAAQVSKWFNFGGFVAFQVCAHGGLREVLESINRTVSWIGKWVLGIGERASLTTVDAAYCVVIRPC
jgi:hypothetical protein